MLMAIDIGNTNLHLGLLRGGEWIMTWRARTVADKTADEYAVLIRNFLDEAGLEFAEVSHVVMASVVPALTSAFSEMAHRYFKTEPLIVNYKTKTGVKLDVELPEQVGADRIVNAAAVQSLYGGGPVIVIDFGTATTFDVISTGGAYLGGAIAPGIHVALDALISQTAQLYKISLSPPPSPIGRNTSQALQSGIFLGYLGLIEGITSRIKAELAGDPSQVRVIATGGLAPLFDQHSSIIDEIAETLTLDGLRVIWDLNEP